MAIRTYKNEQMTVERIQKTKNLNTEYNKTSLINLLTAIPFDIINIPLHCYRNILSGDEESRGVQVVGYVNGYNAETDTFDVVIHERCVDTIASFQLPVIYPRVKVSNGDAVKILGLDICPKMYYSIIY